MRKHSLKCVCVFQKREALRYSLPNHGSRPPREYILWACEPVELILKSLKSLFGFGVKWIPLEMEPWLTWCLENIDNSTRNLYIQQIIATKTWGFLISSLKNTLKSVCGVCPPPVHCVAVHQTQPWFHGGVSRSEAQQLLEEQGQADG